jgi:ParB/RepB/Spo0J family partition protein
MSDAVAEYIDHTVHEATATQVSENGTTRTGEQSYHIKQLDIASIRIPDTVRTVSEHLDWLTDSIRTIGLLHPITVKRVSPSSYELLSGHNRLEAVKQLGWETIPAHILHYAENDTLKQELSIADENLCRDDLTDLEFAEALGHAKELYEQLYPDTKHNAKKKRGRPRRCDNSSTSSDPKNGSEPSSRPAFLDHESRILGRSRSSLGNYCFIYKNLTKKARDLIRNHKVADSSSDLYALAKETTDQLALAKILQEYPDYRVQDAKRQLAQQRSDTKKEAPDTATTTDHGTESPPSADHSEVVGAKTPTQASHEKETLTPPPQKKPSLFGSNGKGAMGFLAEVKAYALKQLAEYEEQDILCSTCEEKDGQVVLTLAIKV